MGNISKEIQKKRIDEVEVLLKKGEKDRKRIAKIVGISMPTVTRYIQKIEGANTLVVTRQGRIDKVEEYSKREDNMTANDMKEAFKTEYNLDISLKTIYEYIKILQNEGRIIDLRVNIEQHEKEKRMQERVMQLKKQGKMLKEIQEIIEGEFNKKISFTKISLIRDDEPIRDVEEIKKLCENFYGQNESIKKFDNYISECRNKLEEGIFGKEELVAIKNIVTVTEEYRYIVFYAKAGVKIGEFEEVLKILRNQSNNEFLTKEQKAEIRNLREEVQRLYQSYKAKKMLQNRAKIKETRNDTGLLETQVQAINNKIIQEMQQAKAQEENEDGDEPEI